eukprot:gb/GECG01001628.1/.p1 GENE.gb/GECG01001628.1/~~gb/GECG01001628.1/.p1  ORF type:complete len:144 (+),score=5.42 gb/GECG01001628.1/:1-432(+)
MISLTYGAPSSGIQSTQQAKLASFISWRFHYPDSRIPDRKRRLDVSCRQVYDIAEGSGLRVLVQSQAVRSNRKSSETTLVGFPALKQHRFHQHQNLSFRVAAQRLEALSHPRTCRLAGVSIRTSCSTDGPTSHGLWSLVNHST